MKQTIKVLTMAAAAMFALSVAADAQISINGVNIKFGKKKSADNTEVKAKTETTAKVATTAVSKTAAAPAANPAPVEASAETTQTVSAQDVKSLKTFDCKSFSCLYPADFAAEEQWMDDVFNAYVDGTPCHFNLGISAGVEFSNEELKKWGEEGVETEKKFFKDRKVSPCVVKGNTVYFISEGKEDNVPCVQVKFLVSAPSKHVFSGLFLFLKKDEAKYLPLIDEILASFKAK